MNLTFLKLRDIPCSHLTPDSSHGVYIAWFSYGPATLPIIRHPIPYRFLPIQCVFVAIATYWRTITILVIDWCCIRGR